jgi:hypothetical protein
MLFSAIEQSPQSPPIPGSRTSITQILLARFEELAVHGMITADRKRHLKQLLVRIDLSSASPFERDLRSRNWESLVESLEAARHEAMIAPAIDDELCQVISLLKATEIAWSRPIDVEVCRICAGSHKLHVRHLSFAMPDAWFYLSPADVRTRCEGDRNFLSIDRKRFFIRGILPITVNDQVINIHVWAEVEHAYFAQFIDGLLARMEQRRTMTSAPKFKGILANRLLPNATNVGESIEIDCNAFPLPKFSLTNSDAALWHAQYGTLNDELMSELFSPLAHSQSLRDGERKLRA